MKRLISLLILIVLISLCINTTKSSEYEYCSEDQHHGHSTNGACYSNNDCVIDGCNGEICRSKFEEGMASICVYNPPYPKDLGCNCKCVNKKCMWVK